LKVNRLIPPLLGVPIGYLPSGKPVYPVFGGAEDLDIEPDGEGGEEEDPEGEDDPDEPEQEPAGKKGKYTPPEQSEWLKVQNSLMRASGQAKQRREALAEATKKIAELEAEKAEREAADERAALREQRKPAGGKAKAGGGGVPDLPEGVMTKAQVRQATLAAAKEAEDRAADKYRGMLVGTAARAALVSEGVGKEAANRLVKLLDLGEIELDPDNGEITGGLDEQLESLKTELPQLFAKPEPEAPRPRRRPAPRVTAAPQPEAPERPRSSAELMAQSILGGR
jgi:hypothetical protein